ncbi:hypothetical protein AVEN_258337-1, partial [Araneus ventricosus]
VPECEDSSCSQDETCISTETGYQCLKTNELNTDGYLQFSETFM